jgi:glucose/mannose-6-phosphate isomerase
MSAEEIDVERVHEVDTQKVFKTYESWPAFAEYASRLEVDLPKRSYSRLLFLGLGGSAAAGDILADWMAHEGLKELSVFKGFLPNLNFDGTLAIACSASGATRETVQMAKEAYDRGAQVVTISSGNDLSSLAEERRLPHITVPLEKAPRFSLPYLLYASLAVLRTASVLGDHAGEIGESIVELRATQKNIGLSAEANKNASRILARIICEAFPKIYGSSLTRGVALRFKNALNENAKMHACADSTPDMLHNEVESWGQGSKGCQAIFARHSEEPEIERKGIDMMIATLKEKGIDVTQVTGQGKGTLAELLSLLYITDFASYYAAIRLGVDPYPTLLIKRIKG